MYNCHNSKASIQEREQHFIEELNNKLPQLQYIGGYKDSESKVLLKCTKCGKVLSRCASIIRSPHYYRFRCNYCDEIKRNNKQYIKQLIIKYENAKKQEEKNIKDFKKYLKRNTIYIIKCKHCGKEIQSTHRNKTMCSQCYKKYNKKHSTKSLQKLYKRDKGICYICNTKCDYEDYIILNGTIICGDYYPSIEHVIPISKGGTDDWENIRLAHRKCNNLKGNRI